MPDDGPLNIAEFTDPRLLAIYDSLNPYLPDRQPGFYVGLAAELGAVEIVDLGCGTGLITRELARLGYRVTAVDPAPAMLDIARQRPYGDRVRWIEGDASRLGTPGADLAIMTGHVAPVLSYRRELAGGAERAFSGAPPGSRSSSWTRPAPDPSRQPRAQEEKEQEQDRHQDGHQ